MENNDIDDKNDNEIKDYNNIKQYNITKDKKEYKFQLKKEKEKIIIICDKYIININFSDLTSLTKKQFENINEFYKFLVNIFEKNEMIIKYIKPKKRMRLSYEKNENEKIVITLNYNTSLNTEKKLEKNNTNNYVEINYPTIINMDIYNNIYLRDEKEFYLYINTFEIFKSINNILYLVYSIEERSLIFYDLNNNKKISTIKNCGKICNIKQITDLKNKRDLLITMNQNELRLWDINKIECLINLKNIKLSYACFYELNDNINIIYSCNETYVFDNIWIIKLMNLNGQILKELFYDNKIYDKIYYIDLYYDIQLHNNFIIIGLDDNIMSYDYDNNHIYKIYQDIYYYTGEFYFSNIIIHNNNKKTHLIGLDNNYKRIIIWDFHKGNILNELQIKEDKINFVFVQLRYDDIFCVYLYNKDYFMIGGFDKIIIVDVNKLTIARIIKCNIGKIYNIKKFVLQNIGESFFVQSDKKNVILKNNFII